MHTDSSLPRRWQSAAGLPPPRRAVPADDAMTADAAFRTLGEGTALLWQGDFHNAKLLLQAVARRMDRKGARKENLKETADADLTAAFHRKRMAQAQRARLLGLLLVPVDAGHRIPLRRAPDVAAACAEAGLDGGEPYLLSLRELLGIVGAHEWRRKGVAIPALGAAIHPHYGVFSPVRGEYVDLVAKAPLPAALATDAPAFDIGTGTGVLAALLVRRGVARVLATDRDPRALACARDNLARLGLGERADVIEADLFPPPEAGPAALIVCNPPWLPGKAATALDHAVYDPDSRMLRGFLAGLRARLAPGGEGWLILSDLAERLGLRTRQELLAMIEAGGLRVIDRLDLKPRHPRAADTSDPLHAARAAETTSLWRLAPSRGD